MMSDTDFAIYADNNALMFQLILSMRYYRRLETAAVKLFKWFADNQMKANQDKCHLIVSKNVNISINAHCSF